MEAALRKTLVLNSEQEIDLGEILMTMLAYDESDLEMSKSTLEMSDALESGNSLTVPDLTGASEEELGYWLSLANGLDDGATVIIEPQSGLPGRSRRVQSLMAACARGSARIIELVNAPYQNHSGPLCRQIYQPKRGGRRNSIMEI